MRPIKTRLKDLGTEKVNKKAGQVYQDPFLYLKRGELNPNSFSKTNFDLENPKPQGGPINDPSSGFIHKFTPKNTYSNFIKNYSNDAFSEFINNYTKKFK
jgi:hypothetical protein